MGGTLYLDVPNSLTADTLNKRLRGPIMEAIAHVDAEPAATTFRVVNPELIDAHLTAPIPIQSGATLSAVPIVRPAVDETLDPVAAPSRSDTRLNPKEAFMARPRA